MVKSSNLAFSASENGRLVAECKAHSDKMGGADMNKLLGIVAREREKHEPTPITAYFVSLNGIATQD